MFIVFSRLLKAFLAVFLILCLCAPCALAVTDGVQIMDVVQNGGQVRLYLVQSNSAGVSSDVFGPESYTVSFGNDAFPASQVTSLAQSNVNVDYTILFDATMPKETVEAANTGITRFASSMENERLRMAYYYEDTLETRDFATTGDQLKTTGDNASTRLRLYYKTDKNPDMNDALLKAMEDIGQSPNSTSAGLRNVLVVISDTDANVFSNAVRDRILQYRIPIYVILLGSGGSGNAGQYARISGGQLYKTSVAADNVSRNLENIRAIQKNMVILEVTPDYDVFERGTVPVFVTLNTGSAVASSQAVEVSLNTRGVPVPTPPPTPTVNPVTASPVPPTLPPTATPTAVVTPTPEPTATPVPATATPAPATAVPVTEPPSTIPPTESPTQAPTAAPTSTPAPEGGDWIKDTFGEDGIWIVGAGALFLVAIIILLSILISSKRKKKQRENSLRLSQNSSDDEAMTTPLRYDDDDLEATTYEKSTFSDSTVGLERDDLEETTSSFGSKPVDMTSMFFGSEEETIGDDENEKTVAMVEHMEDEMDKTVRIEEDPAVQVLLTVDYEGKTKENAHQEIRTVLRKKLILGRAADCDVVLKYDTVSSHHLEIEFGPDGLFVTDLNSTNGTKLNGEKITERTALKNNDELMLGFCKVKVELSV